MVSLEITIVFSFLCAAFATNAVLPFLIKRMVERGICGVDMNKINKPRIAEMGGTAVWLGFSSGILLAIFIFSYLNGIVLDLTLLLAGFSTVLLVGFLGVIDDLIGWKKA